MEASVHKIRCLSHLRSKDKNLEKYIYLQQLKDADTNMFYKLCLDHMPVSTRTSPGAVTCIQHLYRKLPLLFIPRQLGMPAFSTRRSSGAQTAL